MVKPVLLAVDDDPQVLAAVRGDLRAHYGETLRIVGAESGNQALEVLRELALRGDPVALLLADQRMPQMTGVEFLAASRELAPDAKRVLLTAYADTEVAITAINDIQLDHYLLKPWDPPTERLYPALDDILDDWWAAYRPGPAGLRVVGHRWSAEAHEIKEFLARNQVPYVWVDVEAHQEEAAQLRAGADEAALPFVVLPDGEVIERPNTAGLAERVGLHTQAKLPFYDLLVIGAGPAGLAAGVYGSSEGLKTLVVERLAPGGQAGMSSLIENYLGFPKGLSGSDLARRAQDQAIRLGAELVSSRDAVGLTIRDGYHVLALADGSEVAANAAVLATGVSYRQLPAPGVDSLAGRGVYYSAGREEAVAHTGEDVFVVGGGNSAGQAAVYLSAYAANVTVIIRSDSLAETMSAYLSERLEATPNIHLRANAEIAEGHGSDRLEGLTLTDRVNGEQEKVSAGAVFIFIGMAPRTDWLGEEVLRDRGGFVLTGAEVPADGRIWPLERPPLPLETSVPGLFAAGDVRAGSGKRVAAAVGEGAMAVRFVHEYLATR